MTSIPTLPAAPRAPQSVDSRDQQARPGTSADALGGTFTKMFDEVNRLQADADRKIEEFATSPDKDIHGTMITLQKADLSLRLLMQIRAKLTAAYQDVMRMQV